MTAVDREQLRAKAEAATSGEWPVDPDDLNTVITLDANAEQDLMIAWDINRADAEFIAAANPAIITDLLNEIDRLEAAGNKLADAIGMQLDRGHPVSILVHGYRNEWNALVGRDRTAPTTKEDQG